ncbi:hypothetical protein V5O48_000100 [Marasmius crinis-equi]|uniref:Xylanolytic transcriptional activator regulatory domain-containing protein n=1 Tax=Marasmius crinis-equi TaxID=585013 RepID=A0ABR3G2Q4_9AGAR
MASDGQDTQPTQKRPAKKTANDGLETRHFVRGMSSLVQSVAKHDFPPPLPLIAISVRRGCPSICPNGSLSSGQGTRYVLADTSQLHAKINEMGQRIRQLEDALAISHSSSSNEPHPLLRDELMSIKFGPERNVTVPPERTVSSPTTSEALNVPGTLSVGVSGQGKYFGRSAGTEALFLTGADIDEGPAEEDPLPPSEILQLSALFPLAREDAADQTLKVLYNHLPPRPRAWTLCETYLEHVSWMFSPIRREEIVDDVLTPIYRNLNQIQQNPGSDDSYSAISPHKLAVLYIIFSLGALTDLTLDPYNTEAENYFQMGKAALGLRAVFDSQELSTIQAVALAATYHNMAGRRYTMDSAWCIVSLASKLAQGLGLHRDSARWNLDSKVVQRRRALFYEVLGLELLHCLALGRPPSIRTSYVDCEFPTNEEIPVDKDGNPLISFYQWKYEFCRDIFSQVIELTLTAEPPNYETILDLDLKVREKTLPPHLNMFMNPGDEQCTPFTYMRGCVLGQYRSVTLLYIHRSFFAQAMLDHPINPLRSPYAPSFLAAYRCASGVIKASLQHYERFPSLCIRWWGIWTHLFTAAVIVGTIVTHSPSAPMAPNAFAELGLAHSLFQKSASNSRRARAGLKILTRLREKATQVYTSFRNGNPLPPHVHSFTLDYGDDELALFGGQTKVIFSKLLVAKSHQVHRRSSSGVKHHTTGTASSPSSENSQSPGIPDALQEVHPSLLEYLSLLPAEQKPTTYQQPGPFPQVPSMAPDFTTATVPAPANYMPTMNGGYDEQAGLVTMESPPDLNSDIFSDSFMDLGMAMSGNAAIDDQWKVFMRGAGIMGYPQS